MTQHPTACAPTLKVKERPVVKPEFGVIESITGVLAQQSHSLTLRLIHLNQTRYWFP
jgi:hypothetical protein